MSLNSDLVASSLAEEVKGHPPPCEGGDGVRQRNVRFRWSGAQSVSVAGSFSDWREVSLNQRCESHYTVYSGTTLNGPAPLNKLGQL